MIVIVRSSVLRVVALTCLLAPLPLSADNCVKQIFNRYCLGGSSDTLPGDVREANSVDGVDIYEHKHQGKLIRLSVKEDRIISVRRRQPPGSWLNFTDWKTKLIRLYGRPEELSEFPAYASSRSSKLNAINAGKGFAKVRWQQDEWTVSLLWDHRDYIALQYELAEASDTSNDE